MTTPDNPFDARGSTANTQQLDDLERRLLELQERLEVRDSDQDDTYRGLLISEVEQRMTFRFAAMMLAAFVLFVMIFYLAKAYHLIASQSFLNRLSPTVAVALVIAPIASLTSVTAMILFGAFRRFKEDDPERIASTSIASEAAKAVAGQS